MLIKNEKQLLDFVKYSPVVVIVTIAIIVNILFFIQNRLNYEKDLKLYEQNYIETNKELIKEQVESIYTNIQNERAKLENELRKDLLNRVNEAYNIVDNINKKFAHEGREKVLKIISESLRELKYNNGRGYFYIHDMNGYNIMHPNQVWLEGKSFLNIQDKKGFYFIKDIVENLKKQDIYYSTYYWYRPGSSDKSYKKISVNRKYKSLNLIISTGEYLDDFEEKVKKFILDEYIKKISFGKNSYVFVTHYDGYHVSHVKKEYIGENRLHIKDKNGFEILKEIIKTAKNGSGYIKYVGTIMPETGQPASKTSYIKGLQDWKWAIGTGFYDKDLQRYLLRKKEELKKSNEQTLKKTIAISVILTLILIFIATYISKILRNFFNNYNERIAREVDNNRKKDMILYQQAKMASMGEMIGNIAHQWRQPLNLISTAASRIKFEDEMGVLTKETQNTSLDNIMKSTNYLSQTIDDFREFFSSKKTVNEFNSKKLYERIIHLVSSRFYSNEVEVETKIEDLNIISYENELLQSLINILNNSVDAFDNIKNIKKVIFFEIKKISKDGKSFMYISIQDNAGGIPEEVLPKVFEAYFTTKHKSQGTGIGLYMTYQIITKHLLGDISVENVEFKYKNENYRGAKFIIVLPLD